jgi:hypothetical protein
MPVRAMAENLPHVNWTVLSALAVGIFLAVVACRRWAPGTRGFLAFAAACAALAAVGALATDLGLPSRLPDSPVSVDTAFDLPRRTGLAALALVGLVEVFVIARRRRGLAADGLGLAAALLIVGSAGLSWGGGPAGAFLLALWLLGLAGATGGAAAAMILAHWYLVTPRLPEAPLVLLARLLLGVLLLQVVFFVVAAGLGLGVDGLPGDRLGLFAALTGPWAFFGWMRLLIGIVFSTILAWMALRTASLRAMESATGLLYIGVGTVATGTILAAGLYFGAGLFT